MSLEVSVVYDVIASMRLAEADRVGIIDHEWYKNYLKNYLESMGFKHFAKSEDAHILVEEVKPYNKIDETGRFMRYLERACELLNKKKDLKFKYTETRAFNCFMRHVAKEKPPVHYLALLMTMTDYDLKCIKNVGPHTFDVLQLARDIAIREYTPTSQAEINKWAESVYEKYKTEPNVREKIHEIVEATHEKYKEVLESYDAGTKEKEEG